MKTLKVMGIIGIILAALAWVGMAMSTDTDASIGWGFIAVMYLLSLAIVALVQGAKRINKDKIEVLPLDEKIGNGQTFKN